MGQKQIYDSKELQKWRYAAEILFSLLWLLLAGALWKEQIDPLFGYGLVRYIVGVTLCVVVFWMAIRFLFTRRIPPFSIFVVASIFLTVPLPSQSSIEMHIQNETPEPVEMHIRREDNPQRHITITIGPMRVREYKTASGDFSSSARLVFAGKGKFLSVEVESSP